MSTRALRLLFWGFLLLLCSAVLLSCVQERVGFSDFYEISCDATPARVCRPIGRWLRVERTVSTASAKRSRVVVTQFERDGTLINVFEQSDCVVPDAQTFACQGAMTSRPNVGPEPTAQRWSMVHGHLQLNQLRPEQGHFLNALSLWRNSVLFGSYDYE
jgi:hypothetical protein